MTATEANPTTTISPVGWFEIVGSDPAASETFYSDLFGWQFGDGPTGPAYRVAAAGDGPMGGITSSQAGLPETYAIFSILVPDVGAVCDRITELGGKVLVGPQVMDETGLVYANVTDPMRLAFDATGGGKLASQILTCMEVAAGKSAKEYSRYGSDTHKQVYIYGGLDRSPTTLDRNFGMAWGVGGWLLPPFLQRIGPEAGQKLRERVAREIKTTFASHYTKEVSLSEALQLDELAVYGRQATGEKYLINPNKGS